MHLQHTHTQARHEQKQNTCTRFLNQPSSQDSDWARNTHSHRLYTLLITQTAHSTQREPPYPLELQPPPCLNTRQRSEACPTRRAVRKPGPVRACSSCSHAAAASVRAPQLLLPLVMLARLLHGCAEVLGECNWVNTAQHLSEGIKGGIVVDASGQRGSSSSQRLRQ